MTILQEALAKMLKPLQWRNDGNGDRYGRAAGTKTGSRGTSVYLTDESIHAGELLEHLLDDVIPVVDPLCFAISCNLSRLHRDVLLPSARQTGRHLPPRTPTCQHLALHSLEQLHPDTRRTARPWILDDIGWR